MKKMLYILLIFIFSVVSYSEEQLTIAIVVNKSVKEKVFDKNILSDIYTLNKQYWEDGAKIVVIDKKGEDDLKSAFYKRLDLSSSKLQKIWIRKQFSGKGQAPKTFKTDSEILKEVQNTPGAIGYVALDSVNNNVRVIATISI